MDKEIWNISQCGDEMMDIEYTTSRIFFTLLILLYAYTMSKSLGSNLSWIVIPSKYNSGESGIMFNVVILGILSGGVGILAIIFTSDIEFFAYIMSKPTELYVLLIFSVLNMYYNFLKTNEKRNRRGI